MKEMDYKKKWNEARDFGKYLIHVEELASEGLTTGIQSESMLKYSELNLQRMKRIAKQYSPSEAALGHMQELRNEVVFLSITEGWCGDAAQILPVVDNLAKSAGIEHRVVYRDQHPELMDLHLTNGARSIPKVLVLSADSYALLGEFGPRPSELQTMVMEFKKQPEPKPTYMEFSKQVQLWYARDKQRSIEREFRQVLSEAFQNA